MYVGLVVYGGLSERSGGFRYDRRLAATLEDAGHTVEVVALPWRSYGRSLVDGLSPTVRSRLDRPYDVLLQDELCHPVLWRHNRRLTRPTAIVSLVHLLRSSPGPGLTGSIAKPIERRYLATVDGVVCPSADLGRRVRALTSGDGRRSSGHSDRGPPSVIAPPAGRTEGAAVSAEAVANRARADPFRVLFLGSFVPRKGLHTLVDALERRADDSGTSWEFVAIGPTDAAPEYARRMRERIRRLETVRTSVLGGVPDRVVEAELDRADVLVGPSTYESFGMVYLEAMEYGTVPVATTAGGASEFVSHRENGFLLAPDRPELVSATLAELAADRERLAAMGQAALETADTHPTWAESMARIREFLYERVAAQPAESDDRQGRGSP
ncbi:glycosyltransferase family 4 protein [Halobacteria archaeon AArc-dxtr1]|nr:glycosyltransferase family 4 protein [Halobacteria archaeon AArc-dxtr1]